MKLFLKTCLLLCCCCCFSNLFAQTGSAQRSRPEAAARPTMQCGRRPAPCCREDGRSPIRAWSRRRAPMNAA